MARAAAASHPIHTLELFGGGARIPIVGRAVSEAWVGDGAAEPDAKRGKTEPTAAGLAPEAVGRGLNGTEAVARGCAFQAAMMSAGFNRGQFIAIHECAACAMQLSLAVAPGGDDDAAAAAAEPAGAPDGEGEAAAPEGEAAPACLQRGETRVVLECQRGMQACPPFRPIPPISPHGDRLSLSLSPAATRDLAAVLPR